MKVWIALAATAFVAIVLLIAFVGERVDHRQTRADLKDARVKLVEAQKAVDAATVTDGQVAVDAAKACAAEGDSAFERGVAVGIAVQKVRQCEA